MWTQLCHNEDFKMANIRKRRNRFNVQIRHVGLPNIFKTFNLRADAERWTKATEAAIDRGDFPHEKSATYLTLNDILQRYLKEVVVHKKSFSVETYIICAIGRSDIASIRLNKLRPHHIASHRDQRLAFVTGSTVVRELSIIIRLCS